MSAWAIDLGTCNTAVVRWRSDLARPELVELPGVCRLPGGDDPMLAPHLVPSATHVTPPEGPLSRRLVASPLWAWIDRYPRLARHLSGGSHGLIGRQALDRNLSTCHPQFAATFKPWLGRAATTPLARHGSTVYSARDVAHTYLRELLHEIHHTTGERVRELTLTVPVESFEGYRAELQQIVAQLGVHTVRFVDEPVAAALGYGLGLSAGRQVLVVDFGAGTLDLTLARLGGGNAVRHCEVLAKVGRNLGGDHVDGWMLAAVCARLGTSVPRDPFWHRQLLDEARRTKEAAYVRGQSLFHLAPPDQLSRGPSPECVIDQAFIRRVLDRHHLPELLSAAVQDLLSLAGESTSVDDVLLVGGSTLLPGVFELFEARFGRDRVRAWRPFDAVAYGAAALAAGAYTQSDTLAHDYAILTHDRATGAPVHVPVVRAGTRVPTSPHHWREQLVPTCAMGTPETWFQLVIHELGHAGAEERVFGRDAAGEVHLVTPDQPRLAVPLNAADPTLGRLEPPHLPSDTAPRLDVSLGVDANRWLVATVRDLRSGRTLLDAAPVVRLR